MKPIFNGGIWCQDTPGEKVNSSTFSQEGPREGYEDWGFRVHFRASVGGLLSGDTRAPGKKKLHRTFFSV